MNIETLKRGNEITEALKDNKDKLDSNNIKGLELFLPKHLRLKLYILIKEAILQNTKELEEELNKL